MGNKKFTKKLKGLSLFANAGIAEAYMNDIGVDIVLANELLQDKVTHIYCSKNRKSFNRIPKDYQPFIEKFLGCVIGEFVCDKIEKYCGRLTTYAETPYKNKYVSPEELAKTCLSIYELNDYLNGKNSYFWQISDLKIYDKPKELGEFVNCNKDCKSCEDRWLSNSYAIPTYVCLRGKYMTRPPQSWGYCNSL